ncbi:MAG: NUDIX hydrolase [Candidatus Bathyarchaeia archaeon]
MIDALYRREIFSVGALRLSEFGVLIHSRRIYDGKVIGLRVDRVQLPSGEVFDREVVEHRGAVAMLPMLDDGRLLLIRQYRHPVGKILLEIPAGTLSEGETPEDCARRELVEETGYTAEDLEELFSCFLAPGYSSEKIHLFLASRLRKVGDNPEIDEFIQLEPTEIKDAEAMIKRGEIMDAKTISAISYFLLTR